MIEGRGVWDMSERKVRKGLSKQMISEQRCVKLLQSDP